MSQAAGSCYQHKSSMTLFERLQALVGHLAHRGEGFQVLLDVPADCEELSVALHHASTMASTMASTRASTMASTRAASGSSASL